MTLLDSTSPIVTFSRENAGQLAPKLKAARVDIAVSPHRIRISPSVYNDQSDIDRLLDVLGAKA